MADLVYAPPLQPSLSVLHEDEDLLVFSKQSGLLSVPGRKPEHADSIQSRAQIQYPGATIVHRLDMETSGVMVLARNLETHRNLSAQFEKRQVEKVYIARVFGKLDVPAGKVSAPLICDWPNRPKQIVDYENGKAALTHWSVMSVEPAATRVRLVPKTGRSHQLRVHMLSLGHPILGDQLYAHATARDIVDRLQLHAQSIVFEHPGTGKRVRFEDPCPF